ncbi:MAG: hypothetical protein ACRCVT_03705, partial [Leadbetterella sp.]
DLGLKTANVGSLINVAKCNTATLASELIVDCNSFQSANLNARIYFPTDFIQPFDPSNGKVGTGRVEADFVASVEDINSFAASINFNKPFTFPKANKYGINLKCVSYYQDSKEATDVSAVKVDNEQAVKETKTWYGFYARDISVLLPQEFRVDSNKVEHSSLSIGAKDVLIDPSGFSGDIYYTSNIQDLGTLNGRGWGLTLDRLNITFRQNKFVAGGLGGKMFLPILGEKEQFINYNAIYNNENNYEFELAIQKNKGYGSNAMKGKIQFKNPTFRGFKFENRFEFELKADLVVNFIGATDKDVSSEDLEKTDKKTDLILDGISLKGFAVRTFGQRFSWDGFFYSNGGEFGRFPISVRSLNFTNVKNPFDSKIGRVELNIGFSFGSTLSVEDQENLGLKKSFNMAVGLAFDISKNYTSLLKYKSNNLKFMGGDIGIVFGGYIMRGGFLYTNNEITKEFKGGIKVCETTTTKGADGKNLKIETSSSSILNAKGMGFNFIFGKNKEEDYKYFGLDGIFTFPTAVSIIPAPIPVALKTIGAGIAYNVEIANNLDLSNINYMSYVPKKGSDVLVSAIVGLVIGNVTDQPASPVELLLAGKVVLSSNFKPKFVNCVGVINIVKLNEMLSSEFDKVFSGIKDIDLGDNQIVNAIDNGLNDKIGLMFKSISTPLTIRFAGAIDFTELVYSGSIGVHLHLGFISGSGPDGRVSGGSFFLDRKKKEWFAEGSIGVKANVVLAKLELTASIATGSVLKQRRLLSPTFAEVYGKEPFPDRTPSDKSTMSKGAAFELATLFRLLVGPEYNGSGAFVEVALGGFSFIGPRSLSNSCTQTTKFAEIQGYAYGRAVVKFLRWTVSEKTISGRFIYTGIEPDYLKVYTEKISEKKKNGKTIRTYKRKVYYEEGQRCAQ